MLIADTTLSLFPAGRGQTGHQLLTTHRVLPQLLRHQVGDQRVQVYRILHRLVDSPATADQFEILQSAPVEQCLYWDALRRDKREIFQQVLFLPAEGRELEYLPQTTKNQVGGLSVLLGHRCRTRFQQRIHLLRWDATALHGRGHKPDTERMSVKLRQNLIHPIHPFFVQSMDILRAEHCQKLIVLRDRPDLDFRQTAAVLMTASGKDYLIFPTGERFQIGIIRHIEVIHHYQNSFIGYFLQNPQFPPKVVLIGILGKIYPIQALNRERRIAEQYAAQTLLKGQPQHHIILLGIALQVHPDNFALADAAPLGRLYSPIHLIVHEYRSAPSPGR